MSSSCCAIQCNSTKCLSICISYQFIQQTCPKHNRTSGSKLLARASSVPTPSLPPPPPRPLIAVTTIKRKLSPIRINKYAVFMDCLNDLTQQRFEQCKSRITFQQIEEKIKKNSLLCILFIQNVHVFNNYDLPNSKIPPKFSWEAIYSGKTLQLTTPYSYTRTCHGLVDFMFKSNAKKPLKLKLWKVKNYEESYIGEIELSVSDFVDFEVAMEYQGKMIKETFVQKEMFKVFDDSSASIGQVSLKIIQFCSSSVPSNKLSNIPGSPKTSEQRKKHLQIEESKGKGFEWGSSKDEDYIIFLIGEALKETGLKEGKTMEQVLASIESMGGWMTVLIETYYEPTFSGRKMKYQAVKRKQREEHQGLYSILIIEGQTYELFNSLKHTAIRARIKRSDLEAGLQTVGCTAAELIFLVRDDMGCCLFDYLLESDSLPEIVLLFHELVEREQTLEQFAMSLFENIRQRLRKNHYLKALAVFIKALGTFPAIGEIVARYALSEENIIISETTEAPFCTDFNPDDYQHVIVLAKIRKLCQRFLQPNVPFMISLERTYQQIKKANYFKIPMLPRKFNPEKLELLVLKELKQNIFHEIVRRKRWNLFNRTYKDYEDLVYEQDNDGISPMMNFLENAPLDQILQLESLKDQISKLGKTSLHFLLMNPDLSVSALYQCITKFNILNDKIWMNFTPLALFLERLVHKQKKHKSRIIKEMKAALENNKKIQIIDILASPSLQIIKSSHVNKYLLYSQNIESKQFAQHFVVQRSETPFKFKYKHSELLNEWNQFYHHHTIPAVLLCRLDENIQELIWAQFDWINWLAPRWNYPYERFNGQTLLSSIAKTAQSQIVFQILQKETPLIYKDRDPDYQDTDKYNYLVTFQNLLQDESIPPKLRDDINKKYKPIKEPVKEDNSFKSKFKQCLTLLKSTKGNQNQQIDTAKYQQVLDIMNEQLDLIERSLKSNFKFNIIAVELVACKSLNFAKLFKRAYEQRFDTVLNFVDILIKALNCNNMHAVHLALYYAQLRQNQVKRTAQVKQPIYLQALQTHWAIELEQNQFQQMYLDIKDICLANDLNKIIYILAMNGRYNKLKLVIERMSNQNYLIQALPIAAHQISPVRNLRYYKALQELLAESDVKRLYLEDSPPDSKASKDKQKIEIKKPFDKQKPVFCKWIALQGALQTQLSQLYKSNNHNRLKSEWQISQRLCLQFWGIEYQYKLRRLFTRQNFRSVFYQYRPKEADFVKTVELLIEKILYQKLTPTDEFFNYIHVHDKFSELLSQSPNQNVCIIMAFKSMINLFEHEQSNDVLSKCINFLKKYLNSKIFKDLNEQGDNFQTEAILLQKYLRKVDPQYLKKSDPVNNSTKFAQEVILLMDQNFTTQEYESLQVISHPSTCAHALIKLKSTDKRVIGFLQKYLNSGQPQRKQYLPFTQSNQDYIINLAKTGLTIMQDNSIEYLLQHGHHQYLKTYFLNALRPKGMLSDDMKLYYLQHAVQSGSPETFQLCVEDLCSLKNNELKPMMIEGNLLAGAMIAASQDLLLFLTRKVLKLCTFTSKEILKLLLINENVAEPFEQEKKHRSPLFYVFMANCEAFYKEFFIDYLQKILPNEYKTLISKIFNSKIQLYDSSKKQLILGPSVFQLAIECGFYDVVQTAVTLSMKLDLTFIQDIEELETFPARWLMLPPQQLENMLKQDHYKLTFKQSSLKLYRICKYHLSKIEMGSNLQYLRQLEICLQLTPLLQEAQPKNLSIRSRDSILDIFLDRKIDPNQKPLLFLMKMLLDQEDKANNFILVESFCDKHPQIMHDKFYTQVIKNREANELLRVYYPEVAKESPTDFNITFSTSDNVVAEYLILQDPIRFIRYIASYKQIFYALRVVYDKNLSLKEFYNQLQEPIFIIIAGLCLLIINAQQYTLMVFEQFKSHFNFTPNDQPYVTQIFEQIIKYHKSVEGTYVFFVHIIQQLLNNVVYQQLIQVKPIGDLATQVQQERQFLDDIKAALNSKKYVLPDNSWALIIQSQTKAIHTLQQDKWFHGFSLIKSILNICTAAESVIHDIQSTSYLDDIPLPGYAADYWDLKKQKIEIKIDLFPADQVAQHKVVVQKLNEENSWRIKYPLGLVKDSHFTYPSALTSQKGNEFARHQMIQIIYESQKRQNQVDHPNTFTLEGVSHENIQFFQKEKYEITQTEVALEESPVSYNGKVLASNYLPKKKPRKDFSLNIVTTNISVQVVSKEEFVRREKAQFLFNQIIEDPSTKVWTYYFENQSFQSLKDDELIFQISNMIKSKLPKNCYFHLVSFVECYLMKIAVGFEKTNKKSISAKMCVDLGLQWDLLFKVCRMIMGDLGFAQCVCFEFAEIDPKKTFTIKLDGFDSVFRLGQTELFVLNNLLIVRLNIAVISQSFNALLQQYLSAIYNDQVLQALVQ